MARAQAPFTASVFCLVSTQVPAAWNLAIGSNRNVNQTQGKEN